MVLSRVTSARSREFGTLSMWLAFVIFAAAGAGCIGSRPPERLAEATPVATLVWLETADGAAADVPDDVVRRVEAELRERNLVPKVIAGPELEALRARVQSARTTEARLEALAAAAPDAPWVLLIEARAVFFSQLAGRYRWDVDVRATMARRDDRDHAQASTVGVAAFLQYEHERESAALGFVRQQVVGDVVGLVDRALAR